MKTAHLYPAKKPTVHAVGTWKGAHPQPKRALPQGGTKSPTTGRRPKHVKA